MFEVTVDKKQRVLRTRMSGYMSVDEMKQWCAQYRAGTDSFQGASHMVLADMRGFKAMVPEVGSLMGETIGYARGRGVYRCVHLSDSTITQLQTARLARQNSPGDDVTVDVVSAEEAERALIEFQAEMMKANLPRKQAATK